MPWSARFVPPITHDGKTLATLRDAGNYVSRLPKADQERPAWQTAAELLLLVGTKGGDPMLVRIAMMQALNAGREKPAVRRGAKAYKVIR